jgi:hypothetical protein
MTWEKPAFAVVVRNQPIPGHGRKYTTKSLEDNGKNSKLRVMKDNSCGEM